MVVLVFRELVVITAGLVIIWALWKFIRKVRRNDSRRENLQECMDNIDEILKLSNKIPKVDVKKLQEARDKLNNLIKEGEKK